MLIVDRFEGDKAIVFDGEEQLIISREELNASVREGDVIFKDKSGIYVSDKTYDFTSGTGSQPVYSIRTSLSGQNVCILIEPDTMMKESMNKWLAPHMQLK